VIDSSSGQGIEAEPFSVNWENATKLQPEKDHCMDTSLFDNEIAQLEAEKKRLSDEAEVVAQKYVKLMQDHFVAWAPSFIEQTVKQQTEVTKSLGVDGLRKLKADTPALISKLPDVVRSVFDKDKNWPLRVHTRSSREETDAFHNTFQDLHHYSGKTPRHLISDENESKKAVVEFLGQFGYKASVFEDIGPTAEGKAILDDYERIYKLRWKVIRDIELVRSKKEKAEAEFLWDQA
jgi:hypothetical protein